MIRALVALGKWLDARFPVKVHVTLEMWDALNEDVHTLRDEFNAYKMGIIEHNAKIHGLEEAIHAIKDAIAKGPIIAADKRRSDFIAQGRMSD